MWKYTAPCVNVHKRKYTFPYGEIHIKLRIPALGIVVSTEKKVFRISSVEFYVYKKTQIKQNFRFAYMFPCFMLRFGNVYYKTALPVGYVPQW